MSLNHLQKDMSSFSISYDDTVDAGLHTSGYSFSSSSSSSSSNVTINYTSNNNEVTAQANIIPISVKEKKIYPCNQCSKFFNRPSALETHNYTHTQEKPFQCLRFVCIIVYDFLIYWLFDLFFYSHNCGRRFSVVSNLRRHFKVHQKGITTVSKISSQERLHCVRKLIKRNSRNPNATDQAPLNFYSSLANTALGYGTIDSQSLTLTTTTTTMRNQNDTMLPSITLEDDITQYLRVSQMVTEQETGSVIQKPYVFRAVSYNLNRTQNDDQLLEDRPSTVAYQQPYINTSFTQLNDFHF